MVVALELGVVAVEVDGGVAASGHGRQARLSKDDADGDEQDRDEYEATHDDGHGYDCLEERVLGVRTRRACRVVAATPAAATHVTTAGRPTAAAARKTLAPTAAGEPV